jgi:putative spermidine/putrescine transport system permease protein
MSTLAISPPQEATGAAPRRPALALVLPQLLFFAVFVLVPFVLLGYVSLHSDNTMAHFSAAQYVKFLADPFNRAILGQTLWLACQTMLLAMFIGYPLAYLYITSSRQVQRILMLLILLPLLTSSVVRTFGWVVILGRQGILNNALAHWGWIEAPLKLLYTQGALVVALAQIELPLMVLPLITALARIDGNLLQAAEALGAGRWRIFWCVTVPLSLPGLFAGAQLVFAGAASGFITQTLVGGGQLLYMPFYIYQQAVQANNYPFSAATAVLLLIAVLGIVSVANLMAHRSRVFAHD